MKGVLFIAVSINEAQNHLQPFLGREIEGTRLLGGATFCGAKSKAVAVDSLRYGYEELIFIALLRFSGMIAR